MTIVKICGLSTPESVKSALDGGAAFVGFNHFPKSPRYVGLEVAAHLAEAARRRSAVVAVLVDPDDALLDAVARILKPDFVQLHGRETPERAAQARARTGAGVIKVVSVSEAADLDAARAFEAVADHLMFDTKPPPGSALPGGTGVRFDWTLLQGRRFDRPWFLAGGLDPWNLNEAVSTSGAPMVDVSSGVERGRGVKDPALIAAFLQAAARSGREAKPLR